MPTCNIRFADFATGAPGFELQVEQDTTVGALKAMALEQVSKDDNLCPMKYFDKWYLEEQVRDRKKLVGIDAADEGLTLAAVGLQDQSVVYLEGMGWAIAVRAQHVQVQGLMAEMGRRFDALEAKQEQSEAQSKADKALKQQSEATSRRFQKQLKAIQWVLLIVVMGVAIFFCGLERNGLQQLKYWAGMQRMKEYEAEVDSLLQKHSNRPLKALWEVLNDKANLGIELAMAIIEDSRCGIERRAGLADGEMKSGNGFTTNVKGFEGATPLIMAVLARRNDVVSALKANADYEAVFTFRRWSALDIAAIINNADAITLLGNSGADVSKRSKFNSTPLHEAAYQGNAAAIEALKLLWADLTAVNDWGSTPLQTFAFEPHAHLSEAEKVRLKDLLTPKPLGHI